MPSSASLLALLLTGAAAAAPVVPEAATARVAAWFAAAWGVPESSVRLEWARPTVAPPAGEVPFRVTGRGDDGWRVVVFDPAGAGAVAVRVRAGREDTVSVAARAVAAGAVLAPGDVKREPRVCWGPPGAGSGPCPGPGWQARRALAAGDRLARPAVSPPLVIAAGAPVRLMWSGGQVEVNVRGVALQAARQGEPVRVRVAGRADCVVGTAVAAGTAMITNGGER